MDEKNKKYTFNFSQLDKLYLSKEDMKHTNINFYCNNNNLVNDNISKDNLYIESTTKPIIMSFSQWCKN